MYLMHVTKKDWALYFVDGHEGSDEHHTGEWVKGPFPSSSLYLTCDRHPNALNSLCPLNVPPLRFLKGPSKKCSL
jgi:hypothetical protein